MSTDIIAGRSNLACTIFVPVDCKFGCPFCTSKHLYSKQLASINQDIEHIKAINKVSAVTEFVFTGGEPFADLSALKTLVDACEKKVFINTTLPLFDNIDEVIDYINTEDKIHGINISRHMSFNFKNVADISVIDRIKKPVRINSVIGANPSEEQFDKIEEFINFWSSPSRFVNLRQDYRYTNRETLKVMDAVDDWCLERYLYMGTNCCMVCNTEFFGDKNHRFSYHRGLQFSSFIKGNKLYIGDIIVAPNGKIFYDWDFSVDTETDVYNSFIDSLKTNSIV